MKNWEVANGAGSEYLTSIAQDIFRLGLLEPNMTMLEEQAKHWQEDANRILDKVIDSALGMGGEDLAYVLAGSTVAIGATEKNTLARVALLGKAYTEANTLKHGGRYFGDATGQRVRLKILRPGVTRQTVLRDAWEGYTNRVLTAKPGKIYEGRVYSFRSEPHEGGVLDLVGRPHTFKGLVDPDGEPRIHLDILTRSQQS